MKWFGQRSTDSASSSAAAIAQAPEPQITVQTSLALNVLYHHIQQSHRKLNILDLGAAFGANVDFFSQFTCRVYIEDLYETLASFDYLSPEDGFSYEAVFEYLLPYRRNTKFDIILTWDLVNYLERDEFHHLVSHLTQFCGRGTLLFALVSTLKYIPEQPTHFRIEDTESLQYELQSQVLKACPRYQQPDLDQIMPGFRVSNSFLLRNGFKEYLFLRD